MKLKIMSLNIHKGFNWNNTKSTISEIKSFLEENNPDLVFLQEVVGENKKNAKKYSQFMSQQFEFLADGLWHEYAYAKNAVYDGRHHGNVTLSKYPITTQAQIDISTNKLEQRGILFCEIEAEGKKVHTYNVHLNLTHQGRKKQYSAISEVLKSNKSDDYPCIIAGDFNDWSRKATGSINPKLKDAHKTIHKKYAKTFPSFFPLFSLDRIYTQNFQVFRADVLQCSTSAKISDHLSLLIEGRIN
ncbi:MAG: hypothetical protein CME62_13870 [Halobacteriovoraceae bacterium]|nr:hypothetical protein [Halobacteriovoraceae bacterium]|tara:strand:- start:7659 stop:8390 length:732 start_codon:yes stop_codon:yes gene_type:complete